MGTNWASNSFSSGGSGDWTTRATRFKNSQGGASPNGGGNLGMNAGANAPQPNAPAAQPNAPAAQPNAPALGGFDAFDQGGGLGGDVYDIIGGGDGFEKYRGNSGSNALPYSNTVGPQLTDESMYTADGAPAGAPADYERGNLPDGGPDGWRTDNYGSQTPGRHPMYPWQQQPSVGGQTDNYGQNLTYGMPADGWQANLTGQPQQQEWNQQPQQPNQEVHDAGIFDSMPESWYSDPGPQWETDPDYQITSGPNGGSSYRSKFYDPEMAAKYGNPVPNPRGRGGRGLGGGAVHYGSQDSYYDSMRQRERGLYFG